MFLKIFKGVNLGSRYYGFMKKTRLRKSHATVPLKGPCREIFWPLVFPAAISFFWSQARIFVQLFESLHRVKSIRKIQVRRILEKCIVWYRLKTYFLPTNTFSKKISTYIGYRVGFTITI